MCQEVISQVQGFQKLNLLEGLWHFAEYVPGQREVNEASAILENVGFQSLQAIRTQLQGAENAQTGHGLSVNVVYDVVIYFEAVQIDLREECVTPQAMNSVVRQI